MFLFDAHLDLSMNALEWNRDLTRPIREIRDRERGQTDKPVKTLKESFMVARRNAGLDCVGFHDLRHYFSSIAVMSGIDFKTIAEWLGHQDGGMLVGKVYGHLLPEHKQRMAERLIFGPTVIKFPDLTSAAFASAVE